MKNNKINSLENLYLEYRDLIYCFFYRVLNNNDIADDLTQETFYQAFISIHRFKGHSSVKTWLYSIARNTLLNYFNKKKKLDNLTNQNSIDVSYIYNYDSYQVLQKKLDFELVRAALSRMNPTYSSILIMREIDQMNYKQISIIAKKNETTLRCIHYRAKQQFIKIYKSLDKGGDLDN